MFSVGQTYTIGFGLVKKNTPLLLCVGTLPKNVYSDLLAVKSNYLVWQLRA